MLLPLVVCGCLLGGCSSISGSAVTRDSIVSLPSGLNLLQNPGFHGKGPVGWAVSVPRGVRMNVEEQDGRGVLTITRRKPGVTGALLVTQRPAVLPDTNPGASYILRTQIRAKAVRRPLRTEIKFEYQGGGYAFFSATPTGTALSPAGSTAAVSGSTHGWITVRAEATAALPLVDVEIFIIDSLPTPKLSGAVSIKDPVLLVAPHTRSPG